MHAVQDQDFTMSSNVFTARPGSTAEIIVTYRVDSIAQELIETARVRLSFTADPPTGTILQDMLDIVIIDNDSKYAKLICI